MGRQPFCFTYYYFGSTHSEMAQRQAVLGRKDNPSDRAIKSDKAKVVMTAGCISINLDTTKETTFR